MAHQLFFIPKIIEQGLDVIKEGQKLLVPCPLIQNPLIPMLNSINFDGIFSTGAFFHDRIFSTFHSVKISTAGISTEKFRQQKMAS